MIEQRNQWDKEQDGVINGPGDTEDQSRVDSMKEKAHDIKESVKDAFTDSDAEDRRTRQERIEYQRTSSQEDLDPQSKT